ncbi:patatin-like phospholipase family protein [Streptomyces sp. NPDC054863]
MSDRKTHPTRALVLGGGGAVGVGWQAGLMASLPAEGVDLSLADVVVGTSAGSLTGALLTTGRRLTDAHTAVMKFFNHFDPAARSKGSEALASAMQQVAADPDSRGALISVGRVAQEHCLMDEETYLSLLSQFAGIPWPKSFRCTAIDANTGELVVWGPDSGVPLQYALAASMSVPTIFPTVPVHGRRYMDGGILSHLNAAAAPATDVLLALSCFALGDQSTGKGPRLASIAATVNDELTQTQQTRKVLAIDPDFGDDMAAPNFMGQQEAESALVMGERQATRDSSRIRVLWQPDAQ